MLFWTQTVRGNEAVMWRLELLLRPFFPQHQFWLVWTEIISRWPNCTSHWDRTEFWSRIGQKCTVDTVRNSQNCNGRFSNLNAFYFRDWTHAVDLDLDDRAACWFLAHLINQNPKQLNPNFITAEGRLSERANREIEVSRSKPARESVPARISRSSEQIRKLESLKWIVAHS